MRKWIYTALSRMGTVTTAVDGDTIEARSGTEFYVASEVDMEVARLKRRVGDLERVERLQQTVINDLVKRTGHSAPAATDPRS